MSSPLRPPDRHRPPSWAQATAALPRLDQSGRAGRLSPRLTTALQLAATAIAGIVIGVLGTHALVRPATPDPSAAAALAAPTRTAPTIFRVESPTPPPAEPEAAAAQEPAAAPPAPQAPGSSPPPTTPEATPTADASISRLIIPAIEVDAPVVELGLDAHKVMESPSTPEEIAWYGFSGRPGMGSNAVFSGHLDFAGYGPAVFWRLRDLVPGDRILVAFDDGSALAYRVTGMALYNDATAPVDQIIGPTQTDQLTLITCAGLFNRAIGRYDDRLVVHAERV